MFKLTVVCVILALAVMSEGYVKSNRGHDNDGGQNSQYPRQQEGLNGGQFNQGSHGSGSQYPRPQEGLGGGHQGHGGGSQYPRPQEGLNSGFQQGHGFGSQGSQGGFGGSGGHGQHGGNQYGNDQGGYKRHGY
ncbi:glycine-rich cell wall structural protein-like isoform X1 [Chrysoperla carnea]|uniref:glycine-rich cell wall structural protein-like isoform X1 n=1 Tax=Chrysoperla carnea TaxID=189513 RepID=UPI001D065FC8|nr:glycine-rich cell wall structural protein-like isoform X1 [Chrysoperla carnea]